MLINPTTAGPVNDFVVPNDHDGDRGSVISSAWNESTTNHNEKSSRNSSCSCSDVDTETVESTTRQEQEEIKQQIAVEETKHVNQVKFLFFIVLVVSIIGAVLVYIYMERLEQDQFESKFYADAEKLLGSLGTSLERALGALDSLAAMSVSLAYISNQTFPFVTIPELGLHIMKTMPRTGAISTYLLPVVTYAERREWELYASGNNTNLAKWLDPIFHLQDKWDDFHGPMPQNYTYETKDVIYSDNGDIPYDLPRKSRFDMYLPEWMRFPVVIKTYQAANWDWYSQVVPDGMTISYKNREVVLSPPFMIPSPNDKAELAEAETWCEFYKDFISSNENCMEPVGQWYYPVLDSLDHVDVTKSAEYPDKYEVKAIVASEFYWRTLIRDIIPDGSKGIVLLFLNTCTDDVFTYQIDGPAVKYLGVGDYHDAKYNDMTIQSSMNELNLYQVSESENEYTGLPISNESCTFTFQVYPSQEMEDQFNTSSGIIFALSAVALIVLPFLVFLIYDRKVSQQRQKIVSNANRSNAIISSLFPSSFRDELMYPTAEESEALTLNNQSDNPKQGIAVISKSSMKSPLAKLYPETTVLFADIANFTVWASVRDAFQVFTLLENIYVEFDNLAKKRRVFKVETVGDSYIAVAGLPEPRFDHAVVMVKFGWAIINAMETKVLQLEVLLGPGTSNLTIRVGLNSGPTTAGVLRGAKGRFQLFGDTSNTAARMERNSIPGRIMCTEQTANILIASGKEHWVTKRSDLVETKGKGRLQCYWCDPTGNFEYLDDNNNNVVASPSSNKSRQDDKKNGKHLTIRRLVDWITDMFAEILAEVVANREGREDNKNAWTVPLDFSSNSTFDLPRDEVSEIITLRTETRRTNKVKKLDETVKQQLHDYITVIASWYNNNNPFHNFEHACHVVMATKKLLSRVVKSDGITSSDTAYGLSSDLLTQFAILFSALIHDVDHPGVSNGQLVKEQTIVAVTYKNKSVAEQNSVMIAWKLLLDKQFNDLRMAIMPDENECKHFRQVIVNAVLATDLFDRELKELRENRWTKAFQDNQEEGKHRMTTFEQVSVEDCNRRATIVIEHIIQAADVSHTMQHWHIYQQWNRNLLREMYSAYLNGRSEKDPTVGWYDGELWFFDNYVIPLAKKLKTCGVFGVSCDELLDYANRNRDEWAAKGKGIVEECVELIKSGQFLSSDTTATSDPRGSQTLKSVLNTFSDIIAGIHLDK